MLPNAKHELDIADLHVCIDRRDRRIRDLTDERDGALDRMLAMETDLEDCVAVVHAVRRYRAGLLTYEALIAMVSEEAPA